jgi:NADH-quinone oxidoreductase subunit M
MDQLLLNQGLPLLSILIFLPLAGSLILFIVRSPEFARYWALAVTSAVALLSLTLLTGFDRARRLFSSPNTIRG